VRAPAEGGMSGLAAAFAVPATLPSLAEITDPAAWVARAHG